MQAYVRIDVCQLHNWTTSFFVFMWLALMNKREEFSPQPLYPLHFIRSIYAHISLLQVYVSIVT